jgi:hypothetical protein
MISKLINYSTLIGNTITTSTIAVNSTMISIGASTNQSYSVLSQGTTTTWVSSLSSLVSTSVVIMNTNGQNQYVITSVSTISSIYLTTNTGKSWSVISGTTGLPTAVSTTYLIFFSSTANTTITVLPTNASYPIVVGSTTSVATGTYTYPSTGSATLGLQVATSASITVANSYHTATRIA